MGKTIEMMRIQDVMERALRSKELPYDVADVHSLGSELGYLSRDEVRACEMLVEELNIIHSFSNLDEKSQRVMMGNLRCLGATADVYEGWLMMMNTASNPRVEISFANHLHESKSLCTFAVLIKENESAVNQQPTIEGYIESDELAEKLNTLTFELDDFIQETFPKN